MCTEHQIQARVTASGIMEPSRGTDENHDHLTFSLAVHIYTYILNGHLYQRSTLVTATPAGHLGKQVRTQNHGKVSFVENATKFQECHLQHDLYARQLAVESNQTFYSQINLLKLLPQGRRKIEITQNDQSE